MLRFCKNLNTGRKLQFCLASAFALTLLSNTASAIQNNSSQVDASLAPHVTEPGNKKNTRAKPKKLPAPRIAQLKDFAKEHHPEIMPLLSFLAKKHPHKFHKVMDEFDRDVSNLEKAKRKSPEAYQNGLAAWVNQSQTQLHAAQYKVADDEETAAMIHEQIQVLVTEKIDTRIKFLQREQAAALAKANRLEKVIENQLANRETLIRKRIAQVTRQAPNMSEKKNRSPDKEKPAKENKADQPPPADPAPQPTS